MKIWQKFPPKPVTFEHLETLPDRRVSFLRNLIQGGVLLLVCPEGILFGKYF
jgi:hypothetical protein